MEALSAKLKYALAVYFMFGGVPITLAVLILRARSLVIRRPVRFLCLMGTYVIATRWFVKRYPLGVRPKNTDFSLTRALIEPLYRLEKGRILNVAKSPLDPNVSYLYALAPHGLLPFEWLVAMTTQPETPPVALSASVIFRVPFIRELYSTWGIEASPQNFERILQSKRSICVLPGGVSEMILSEPGNIVKIVTKNKGFIKMALKYGMPVIPVFAFGVHNLWSQKRLPGVFAEGVAKLSGGTYPFCPWGSFGCFLPNNAPVVHVFGDPVPMPRISGEVSQSDVDYHHERFYRALALLIQETRSAAGYADLTVKFIGLDHLDIGSEGTGRAKL